MKTLNIVYLILKICKKEKLMFSHRVSCILLVIYLKLDIY